MTNLIEKLQSGERLDADECAGLYDLDLFTLGKFANAKRRKLHGKKVFFNVNRHINPTNICADVCKFCAFSANRKNPNPYTMSHEEIIKIVEKSVAGGAKEIHIVSAHNPDTSWQWYLEIFKKIKEKYPQIHVKALTAAEVDFLSRKHGLSYEEVVEKMLEYGVDSMPGGGAEIFDEEVRRKICKGKVSSENWLKMENYPGSAEILKTFAISRLVLDNVAHIKAYWATSTINLAMVAQEFGADDLDGTIEKESIQSAAGAKSASGMSLRNFTDLIQTSGFVPVERDSLYNELKIYDN